VLPDGLILHHFLQNGINLHACELEKFRVTPSKHWCNFKRFNTNLSSEILLNFIRKMKYLSDQFLLFFVFALATLNSYILFVHWHNLHPYRQLATYAFSCLCITVSDAVVE